MARKEFTFYGKSVEELKKMSVEDVMPYLRSTERRKIKRGFTEEEKKLLKKIRNDEKDIKTHCRDMVILPEMIGKTIRVHTGKVFEAVMIQPEMVGHRLGEFAFTRKRVAHSAPGVGATRSSAASSVK